MVAEPQVIVRSADPNDQDEVYPMVRDLATSFAPSQATFAVTFSGLISDPTALVLVSVDAQSGQLFGYLLGFRHETFFADGPVGWVEEIYVRPERRRAGVAKALMVEFERWAWDGGARVVALATRRAHAFYEAIGYEDSAVYFQKRAPG
jgi:GNAT superfamily N-acetyltransferase